MLLLQGCGSSDSPTNYPTTLGDGISIGTTDEDAIIAPNTAKSIAQEVSTILKINVSNYNAKEAINFNKETNYCDISGLKESHNSGNMQKISSSQNYDNCQEKNNHHHGKINIDYSQTNPDGKYPQHLDLSVSEEYTVNNISLKKDLIVNSTIIYSDDKSIKQIQLKINGKLNYNSINYGLQNISQTITY